MYALLVRDGATDANAWYGCDMLSGKCVALWSEIRRSVSPSHCCEISGPLIGWPKAFADMQTVSSSLSMEWARQTAKTERLCNELRQVCPASCPSEMNDGPNYAVNCIVDTYEFQNVTHQLGSWHTKRLVEFVLTCQTLPVVSVI